MRDTGILLYHLGRHQEAYTALKQYLSKADENEETDQYMLPDLVQKVFPWT